MDQRTLNEMEREEMNKWFDDLREDELRERGFISDDEWKNAKTEKQVNNSKANW